MQVKKTKEKREFSAFSYLLFPPLSTVYFKVTNLLPEANDDRLQVTIVL